MKTPEAICITCRSPRVEAQCGICHESLCRKCRVFLSEEEFPFLPEREEALRHTYYCSTCHDQVVEPFREKYQAALEEAKRVNIFYANSKSSIRVLQKAAKPVQVTDVVDRDEAILRLAFQAAQNGFNAVIDVEVTHKKVRNEGWQKQAWSARGLPARVTSHELRQS